MQSTSSRSSAYYIGAVDGTNGYALSLLIYFLFFLQNKYNRAAPTPAVPLYPGGIPLPLPAPQLLIRPFPAPDI